MKNSIQDRQYDSFRPAENDKSSVSISVDTALPVESAGVDWDEIITTFPSNHQELFTYKKNSVTLQTVLVTYTNDKKTILTMTRTRF